MRLLVIGKTQSGKTTALHRLLMHALRLPYWQQVLICDGKGHLAIYRDLPAATYLGPNEIERWAVHLGRLADAVPDRYSALLQRGLYETPAGEPRHLIVIDEVQKGTRASQGHGKVIKDSLSLLAEQSAALGDVLIVSSQRAVNSIPPDVRVNKNAELSMLGRGYFFYKADGLATTSGRVNYIEPDAARAAVAAPLSPDAFPFEPAYVPEILGRIALKPTRAPSTLYLGQPGGGKSYALNHHSEDSTMRRLYADLSQPHRAVLIGLIETAGAVVPSRVPIPELAEIAGLAIQAEPTLLLLDNVHQATPKTLTSVERLICAAEEVALTANEPKTPADRRKLRSLLTRCRLEELKPLKSEQAKQLLWSTLDQEAVAKPAGVEKKVLREANGNPGTIVKLARRIQRGNAAELRQIGSTARSTNIGWIVLVLIIALVMVSRRVVDSYTALFLLSVAYIGLRPFIYKLMRDQD